MRTVRRTALVPYSAAQMYALVADVEQYPEFLPWCPSAKLYESNEHELRASISIGLAGLNTSFTTLNRLDPPVCMTMELCDGPFESLEGRWNFEQLGDAGCEVKLQVQFQFASAAQDMLFGAGFEKICNELIDGFIRRAHAQYGESDDPERSL